MKLEWQNGTFPNGTKFTALYWMYGKHRCGCLGSYDHRDGFLPHGCRKPYKSEDDAKARVIRRAIKEREKEIKLLKAIQ